MVKPMWLWIFTKQVNIIINILIVEQQVQINLLYGNVNITYTYKQICYNKFNEFNNNGKYLYKVKYILYVYYT